jgi:hypothetical protein
MTEWMMLMHARLLVTVAVALAIAPAARAQETFRMLATLMDSSGIPAPTVELSDLVVQENGADARIVKVEPANWPIKVQLLLDNGFGMGGGNVSILRTAVRGFLDALPDGVEVTVVTTAPQPRFLVKATTDRAMLRQGVDRLTPDNGSGRFVDSLSEASSRFERDTSEYHPVIVTVGTTVGDNSVTERDVERMMRRLEARTTTVHVALLIEGQDQGAGRVQIDVGRKVTRFNSGRYEELSVASRLGTLLPEFGKLVASSYPREGGRFLITVERPAGNKGELQKVTLQAKGRLRASNLSIDGSRRTSAKK